MKQRIVRVHMIVAAAVDRQVIANVAAIMVMYADVTAVV